MSNVPSIVLNVAGIQKQASGSDPSLLAAMDCLLRPNFYNQFSVVVVLPWFLTAIAFVALNQLHKYQLRMREVEAEEDEQKRDIGPFATEGEYEQRIIDIGLRETDGVGRLFGENHNPQESRRQILEKTHIELDQLQIARQSLLQLPHSKIRDDSVRLVEAKQRMLQARQQGIEDNFMGVGRGDPMKDTDMQASNVLKSLACSTSSHSKKVSVSDEIPLVRSSNSTISTSMQQSRLEATVLAESDRMGASQFAYSHLSDPSVSVNTAQGDGIETKGIGCLMVGADDADVDGTDDIAVDAVPASAQVDGYGTVMRDPHMWHPNIVLESYAQVEEQLAAEKAVAALSSHHPHDDVDDLLGGFGQDDNEEHEHFFDFELAEQEEGEPVKVADLTGGGKMLMDDPLFINPFEAPSKSAKRLTQLYQNGPLDMQHHVANPLAPSRLLQPALQQPPASLVVLEINEKDEGHLVTRREFNIMEQILFGDNHQQKDAISKAALGGHTIEIKDKQPELEMDEHLAQLRQDADENLDLLLDPTETQIALFGAEAPFEAKVAVFDVQSSSSSESGDEEEKAKETEAEQQISLSRQLTLAAVVVFLLLYPTLINKCLLMVLCDDIDYGPPSAAYPPGGSRSLLYSDRSIDCNTDTHQQYSVAALVTGLGYGIGIPLSITAYIIHLFRTRGQDYALITFSYYTAGYDTRFWWWEGVILLRKLAIICISVFVTDESLRQYIAMWFLSFALMGHIQAHPFTNPMLHNMETLSLSTIVITLNLSLLFEFTKANNLLYTGLAVVILLLNFGAILSILFFMGREIHSMFGDFFKRYEETIKALLVDTAMALPLVPTLVEKWKQWKTRKALEENSHIADGEEDTNATVVIVAPDEDEKHHKSSKQDAVDNSLFGRLINTLEGKRRKTSDKQTRKASDAESAQQEDQTAQQILRGRSASTTAPVEPSTAVPDPSEISKEKGKARRKASIAMVDNEFRLVLADRWVPPADYEELWGEIADEGNDLTDLLYDEIQYFFEINQQQVYQLEDTFNRKNAELERQLRLRKAKTERRAYLQRRSQVADAKALEERQKKRAEQQARLRNLSISRAPSAVVLPDAPALDPAAPAEKPRKPVGASILKKTSKYSGHNDASASATPLQAELSLSREHVMGSESGNASPEARQPPLDLNENSVRLASSQRSTSFKFTPFSSESHRKHK